MTLQDYFQKNIFTPLEITDTTFSISSRPALEARVAVAQIRQQEGTYSDDETNSFKMVSDKYKWGGGGLYSTVNDCLRLLQSLLSDDGLLLKSATIKELLSPQVQDAQIFNDMHPKSIAQRFASMRKIAGPLQHSLCGFIGSKTSELGRSGSSNEWFGATNVYWVSTVQSQ
jgi:CubicO group peptidase (beta-lactamase class C family)